MKHIFSKIAKIGEEVRQAEVVKVELSLINNIRKDMEATLGLTSKAMNLISQADISLKKSLQEHKRILSDIEKGLVAAKDLGAESLVKDLEKHLSYAKENINWVKSAISKLDSVG